GKAKSPIRYLLPLGFILAVAFELTLGRADTSPASETSRGAVATGHPLATKAALRAFAQGGNAIDAAVAAALTLGVVDSHNSGLGGGCLMLLRLADGECVALDGRETAPAAATHDMFLRAGKAVPALSQTGALAVGVPGSLAVYELAVSRYGRLSLDALLEPAATLAQQGFALSPTYAARLKETASDLKRFPDARAIFLDPHGRPWPAGTHLRQPDLARTYRRIAAEGSSWFYQGEFAQATDRWMRAHDGRLTAQDFGEYQVQSRRPIRTAYRGYEIVGFPPPSSGGVHVAQILNILEHFPLATYRPSSADFIQLTAEAMKLAFADRAHWLGDPDFTPVPLGLISKEYAQRLANQIQLDRAVSVPGHQLPPQATQAVFGKHTTHFSTADAEGNWVACTATLNTSFGAKIVVPGTGVLLNNQMDDFSAQPGATNYFGLLGAEANAIAPRKRPLSSMSPTLVLKDGQPRLALGASGGPTIISQTLLALLYTIDFGLDPAAALALPRFHHQWRPDRLRLERTLPRPIRQNLVQRGHQLSLVRALAATHAVGRDTHGVNFTAVHDPRSEGQGATR
ncbi:MAG: gamma-glutamyltransferase, partial [Verrucomicrobia bacterium]|nr:gamma-glutamyltransferase [Verrucomicrobiota bacterium]